MLQTFQLALKSLAARPLRAFLTMLGIIIGVTAVIVLVSLMNGMTNYIVESFSDLGADQVTVTVTNTDSRNVEPEDLYEMLEDSDGLLLEMTPVASAMGSVRKEDVTLNRTSVTGVAEGYFAINGLELSSGRFITYSDTEAELKACVVGSYVAQELFSGEDPIGQRIKINGQPYQVVGVLAEEADSEEGSADDCVYLPYSSAAKLSGSGRISQYSFLAEESAVDEAKRYLEQKLFAVFGDEDLYSVTTLAEMMEMVETITGMMTGLLVGIAGISLLVAGVGIMNIQLVSVTERTREIGIRKALGAKRRVILRQFVVEAAVQSSLGGVLGILLGAVLTYVAASLIGFDAAPSAGAVAVAFFVSAGIGVLFGYMPARRAAMLHPIDALRSE